MISFTFSLSSEFAEFVVIMDAERKRAPNFSMKEKTLLLNILHKFKNIIESKKTNSQFWREKDDTWQTVSDMFNAQTPERYPRTKDALRKFYDNIKKNIRKEVADEKKEIFKTGGGAVICVPNPIKDLALGLMNPKTVDGIGLNEFDSDDFVAVRQNDSSDNHEKEREGENTDTEVEHNYFKDPDVTEPLDDQSTSFASPLSGNTERKTGGASKHVASTSRKTKRGHPVHVENPKSDCLKSTWLKRRRPAIQQLPSSKLSEQYLSLSEVKIECFQAEKESIKAREKRDQEIFDLQKRKLSIEIEIALETLKEVKKKHLSNHY